MIRVHVLQNANVFQDLMIDRCKPSDQDKKNLQIIQTRWVSAVAKARIKKENLREKEREKIKRGMSVRPVWY